LGGITRTGWKAGPQRVTAPYGYEPVEDSSRAGHVQSCLNTGGPPSKPKYYLESDSKQVLRGKGEKHPDEGSEIVPETGYLQTVGARKGDGVPFVLSVRDLKYRVSLSR